METQNKLYVFNRNEIILIFAFMVLIAVTSFVFGVKVGKTFSYEQAGLTAQDREQVEMLSTEEEKVNDVTKTESPEVTSEDIADVAYKKLQKEFENLEKEKAQEEKIEAVTEEAPVSDVIEEAKKEIAPEQTAVKDAVTDDQYTGKYTIQLSSHRSLDEAKSFASGFEVRGYKNVIINQVNIAGKGTWFRVNLGVFDSVHDVKEFINKEDTLLKGQDYVITKFQ